MNNNKKKTSFSPWIQQLFPKSLRTNHKNFMCNIMASSTRGILDGGCIVDIIDKCPASGYKLPKQADESP